MKKRILIVMSTYYKSISNGLLDNAKKAVDEPFDLISVPGVFEIPIAISKKKVVGLDGYGIKISKQEIIK